MRTFTLYVHDDRYSVPNLVFADAGDKHAARAMAERELNRSEHHLAVDVREGEDWLFRVRRGPPSAGEHAAEHRSTASQ
jgi:hypothetical protein